MEFCLGRNVFTSKAKLAVTYSELAQLFAGAKLREWRSNIDIPFPDFDSGADLGYRAKKAIPHVIVPGRANTGQTHWVLCPSLRLSVQFYLWRTYFLHSSDCPIARELTPSAARNLGAGYEPFPIVRG